MKKCLVLLLILASSAAWADPTPPSWDEDRLNGFAEHKKEGKVLDKERLEGRDDELIDRAAWEKQRLQALAAFKKETKAAKMADDGPEARADFQAKKKVIQEQEVIREKYVQVKMETLARKRSNKRLVTENEELDINLNLPRYDVRDRVLYGAKSIIKGDLNASKGGGSSPSAPTYNSQPFENNDPGTGYFPPAPTMGMDGGEGNDFEPPPPAMPAPGFEDGNGGEFPPPPPSPDFGELPPPAPFPNEGP